MSQTTETLLSQLIDETRRNTKSTDKLNDNTLKLRTELKTRNEIDKETLAWCRRVILILIGVVCLFAGLDVWGKLGWIH